MPAEEVWAYILLLVPELARNVIALFIVVDPVGNIPIFISLTKKMSETQRRNTFRTAIVTGLMLLFAFALAGQQILFLFGVSLYSFMVAAGILLLILSIRLLITGGWHEASVSPETAGAVPIGFPLLVGPGAITTSILSLQSSGIIVTVLSILITFVIVWLILRFIGPIYRFLGETGSTVIASVMALFIAAIAVQYILQGVRYILQ